MCGINKKYSMVAIACSLIGIVHAVSTSYQNGYKFIENLNKLVTVPIIYHDMLIHLFYIVLGGIGFLAFFTTCVFFYYSLICCFPVIIGFIKRIDRFEKMYLMVASIIITIAVCVIFNMTNLFYFPLEHGKTLRYNVVYGTDTAALFSEGDAYFTGRNRIEHPLAGFFSTPFAIFALGVSKILFFIPNIYPIAFNIMQVLLLQITIILITRILALKSFNKLCFLGITTLSYPFLLYSLNMETYIFSLFWLIVFIYGYVFKKQHIDFYYIAATGSILTSGILFPLLSNSTILKNRIKEIVFVFIKFILLAILFGKLPVILNSWFSIQRALNLYAVPKLDFGIKFAHYLEFVSFCFIKPHAGVDTAESSYRLLHDTTFNMVGMIVLGLSRRQEITYSFFLGLIS
jgi:hypothetical protein